MKIILGLGNPGSEYKNTRHNAGFLALDFLHEKLGFEDFKTTKKIQGESSKGKINRSVVTLLKPNTFMNSSGLSAGAALDFYKLTPKDLIVIHDDKDIPIGEIKVQVNRGAAGHNGVLSIMDRLQTKNFYRIRIGIAPQSKQIISIVDFVLRDFSKDEMKILKSAFNKLPDIISELLNS